MSDHCEDLDDYRDENSYWCKSDQYFCELKLGLEQYELETNNIEDTYRRSDHKSKDFNPSDNKVHDGEDQVEHLHLGRLCASVSNSQT